MTTETEVRAVRKALEQLKADMPEAIRDAHGFAVRHRALIEGSGVCGCFYCLETFAPPEITEWVDNGQTALCPKCGIDSVLPSASGYPLDPDFLMQMNEHWF
jgi:hypothetical protein